MHKVCLVIFIAVLLSGCSVATKFIITNYSNSVIEVITIEGTKTNSAVTVIPSGEASKFRALEYDGFSLKTSKGKELSYRSSVKKFKSDWKKYRGKYICDGPRISLEFRGSLVALHCSEEGKKLELEPDESSL